MHDKQFGGGSEDLDAMLLQRDCGKKEWQIILQETYDFQYPILKCSKTIKRVGEEKQLDANIYRRAFFYIYTLIIVNNYYHYVDFTPQRKKVIFKTSLFVEII